MNTKPAKGSEKNSSKIRELLTPEEIEHFRQLLLEKLKEITGDVHWLENQGLHRSRQDSTGDLSNMPIHMADIGTDTYEQEFSLGLMDSERRLVREILDALKRINQGTYGICEGTGKPIPKGRLEASPWARYCVEYASLLEQGKVIEHRYSGPIRFADGLEEEAENEEEADTTDEGIEEESDLIAEDIESEEGLDAEDFEEEDESFF
ncbi:MAG: TraR/DksA C4-type zinc finger protein [Anaerohalosphaeraceae bacterium]